MIYLLACVFLDNHTNVTSTRKLELLENMAKTMTLKFAKLVLSTHFERAVDLAV